MKYLSRFGLTIACLGILSFGAGQASELPLQHSMESDYGFMIGRWTCHVTQAGTPDRNVSAEYEWSYDKRILRETMKFGGKSIGEFLTSYDKATDRFKGVGVGPWGYVIWENAGFHDSHLSERGYSFDSGTMTLVSRSEFERVGDSHYVVRDFQPTSASGAEAATDTEDCVKEK